MDTVEPNDARGEIITNEAINNKVDKKERWVEKKIHTEPSDDKKVEYSLYILHVLFPLLKSLNEQDMKEITREAEIQGSSTESVRMGVAKCIVDKDMNCDCCKAPIFSLHRRCRSCRYNLCLQCCVKPRDANPKGNTDDIIKPKDPGSNYLHGLPKGVMVTTEITDYVKARPKKINHDFQILRTGKLPCTGNHKTLDLMQINPFDSVSNLLKKAENFLKLHNFKEDMTDISEKWCSCSETNAEQMLKASYREGSSDNYLYCPRADDIQSGDLKHFQWHWSNGEPVIVSNVLKTRSREKWEPETICSRLCKVLKTKRGTNATVAAVNCLDWCEVDVDIPKFFSWYTEGQYDPQGWPLMLKLSDQPSLISLEKWSPTCATEFIASLPFKEYTHPQNGYLNLAVKSRKGSLKPDMGLKTYIAYGTHQELGRGDSVTKIHCDMFDVVNVLTHTATVNLAPSKLERINNLKGMHMMQELKESSGVKAFERKRTDPMKGVEGPNGNKQSNFFDRLKNRPDSNEVGQKEKIEASIDVENLDDIPARRAVDPGVVGAIWDVFRREDTPKLDKYLRRHFKEFRHNFCLPLQQVVHPIHDQTFYLTMDHKEKLKKEFGVEPWTFIQKLGDAVLIPAGCPRQVRNLNSCVNVALNFLTPVNAGECIQLMEDICLLPQNHKARKDILEVKKLVFYAVEAAVKDLECFAPRNFASEKRTHSVHIHQNVPKSDVQKESPPIRGETPEIIRKRHNPLNPEEEQATIVGIKIRKLNLKKERLELEKEKEKRKSLKMHYMLLDTLLGKEHLSQEDQDLKNRIKAMLF